MSTFDTDEDETLVDILTYHVYSGSVSSSQVTDGMSATMLNGDDVTFTVAENGDIRVGEATVTTTDVISSNGIIVIDKVLLPPQKLLKKTEISVTIRLPTVAAGASFEDTAYAYYVDADFGGKLSLVVTTWSPMLQILCPRKYAKHMSGHLPWTYQLPHKQQPSTTHWLLH